MKTQPDLFRRRANRLCILVKGYGMVPVAEAQDDEPVFETLPPGRIGDDAIIRVEGTRRRVRLLMAGHNTQSPYLVDMGPAHW